MHPVLSAARSAFDQILFFKLLYKTCPQDLDSVPFCGDTHFHRANGSMDCLNPKIEPCDVLPPFQRAFRRFPLTVLESDADIDQRQLRLERAIIDCSVSKNARILLIADENSGPFACDLSTGLGWEGPSASIFYFTGNSEDLAFQIEAFRPEYLIWCLPQNPRDFTDAPHLILAHNIDHPLPTWNGPLWLFCDEFNLIGSRPAGRAEFSIDRDQIHIETGPAGRPAITTIKREHFPLIRYELPNAFEVLS